MNEIDDLLEELETAVRGLTAYHVSIGVGNPILYAEQNDLRDMYRATIIRIRAEIARRFGSMYDDNVVLRAMHAANYCGECWPNRQNVLHCPHCGRKAGYQDSPSYHDLQADKDVLLEDLAYIAESKSNSVAAITQYAEACIAATDIRESDKEKRLRDIEDDEANINFVTEQYVRERDSLFREIARLRHMLCTHKICPKCGSDLPTWIEGQNNSCAYCGSIFTGSFEG